MDTRFWGPSGWRLLHLITFGTKDLADKNLHDFFKLLPYVLPCKFCRASLTDYYAADPVPTHKKDYAHWLYRIHNRVNAKLRDQKLLETQDPEWKEIEKRYSEWIHAPCSTRRMVGWDFLFSVAFTTPCPSVRSSPLNGAPPASALQTAELRNRWGVISREERIPFMQKWWNLLPKVLPFQEWRAAWSAHVEPIPNLFGGRKAVTSWLYKTEQSMCSALKEDSPHNSFTGLCSELHTFSSGCGKRSKKMKTCRAVKTNARKTLKKRRQVKYKAVGGFL